MSCKPGLCVSYKADALRGVHHEDDRYMLALYGPQADLDCHVQEYTPRGEVSGMGYRAGGVLLQGFDVVEEGTAVILTFNDVRIERCTLKDVCGGLIYNASKGNRALGVIALEQPTSATNGSFEILFPEPTPADGVFVID